MRSLLSFAVLATIGFTSTAAAADTKSSAASSSGASPQAAAPAKKSSAGQTATSGSAGASGTSGSATSSGTTTTSSSTPAGTTAVAPAGSLATTRPPTLGQRVTLLSNSDLFSNGATDASVLQSVDAGSSVEILETRDGFVRVRTDNGEGWLAASALAGSRPGSVASQRLTLSDSLVFGRNPGLGNMTDGTFAAGAELTTLEQRGEWTLVQDNSGVQGWVRTSSLPASTTAANAGSMTDGTAVHALNGTTSLQAQQAATAAAGTTAATAGTAANASTATTGDAGVISIGTNADTMAPAPGTASLTTADGRTITTQSAGNATLDTGATTLNDGAATLNAGSATLNQGNATTNTGSATLNRGSATTNRGSATLNEGNATTNTGSATLNRGNATTQRGSATQAATGATTATAGTSTASTTTGTGTATGATTSTTTAASAGRVGTEVRLNGGTALLSTPATGASTLTQLTLGTPVTIVAQQGEWTQVRTGTTTGWVRSSMLDTVTDTNRGLGTGVTGSATLATGVRLSSTPGVGGTAGSQLSAGTQVSVLEQRGNWLRVRDAAGAEGWVRSDAVGGLLQGNVPGSPRDVLRSGSVVTVSTGGNLVSQPGTDAATIGPVTLGARVTILERRGDFIRVRTQAGVEGWLPRSSVSMLSTTGGDDAVSLRNE